MASSRQIEDRAADWLAKLDSGAWSDDEQRELDAWLAQSYRHRVAFLRLEAVWQKASRLQACGAGIQSRTVPPPGEWRNTPFFEVTRSASSQATLPRRSSRGAVWAVAASVLFAAVAILYIHTMGAARDHYSTPIGGTASIPLPDGTKITLNTASEVRVAFTKDMRRVELESGEAFFDVAKDPARPFIVVAGEQRIVAVGTRFGVRRDTPADVRVTVTEGIVRFEINRTAPEVATAGAAEQHPVLLPAGTIARASKGSLLVQKDAVQQAENSLSWRTGYLIFDNTALADAVAEFNRYTREPIRIEDPRLAALRISGKFKSDSSDVFLRLLRDGYSIDSRSDGEGVALSATTRF